MAHDPMGLEFRDFFEAGVALVISVVVPWVLNKTKARRDAVDAKLNTHNDLLEQHVTQLAVLVNDKANVAEVLKDIKETNQQMNEKIDAVILKLIS